MLNGVGSIGHIGRQIPRVRTLLEQTLALFRAGDTGWAYDNSNLSTMFQDVAGTVPVTGPGQSVRRQFDISGRGNHRLQPSAVEFAPILGRHPASGIRNLANFSADPLLGWEVSPQTVNGITVSLIGAEL
jgi:hypothetical protein